MLIIHGMNCLPPALMGVLCIFGIGCAAPSSGSLGAGPIRGATETTGGVKAAADPKGMTLAELQMTYVEAVRQYRDAAAQVERLARRYDKKAGRLLESSGPAHVAVARVDSIDSEDDARQIKSQLESYRGAAQSYRRAERNYAKAVNRLELAEDHMRTLKAEYEQLLAEQAEWPASPESSEVSNPATPTP